MTVDMEKIKKRLDRLNNGGKAGEGGDAFWRPPAGDSVVRILTGPSGDPIEERDLHYNVGMEIFLCPKKNFNERCAVCEFASKLYKDKDVDLAKKYFPKKRYYSLVIVRGEKETKLKWWGYGKNVYEKLVRTFANPDYGDISDPQTGTDLTVTMTPPRSKEEFPQIDFQPKRRSSLALEDLTPELLATLMETAPDLESLLKRKTSGEVKGLLDEVFSEKEVVVEGVKEEAKEEPKAATEEEEKAKRIDEAFAELEK